MPPIETDRLLLRVFTMDDLHDVHREVYGDPEVCRYYCNGTRCLEETEAWLSFRITEWQYSRFGRLAEVLKETGEFIGLVGLEAYANCWYFLSEEDRNRRYNEAA